jgi:hypothetical protein
MRHRASAMDEQATSSRSIRQTTSWKSYNAVWKARGSQMTDYTKSFTPPDRVSGSGRFTSLASACTARSMRPLKMLAKECVLLLQHGNDLVVLVA